MRSPVRKIRKLIALPASERRLLFEAWFCFLGTALRLAVASPKSLLDRPGVRVHPGAGGGGADIEAFVARAVELVELAGRYAPLRSTCLKRVLVLKRLLGRRGIESVVRIGVVREGNDIEAHAWLEWEGRPVTAMADDHTCEPLTPAG